MGQVEGGMNGTGPRPGAARPVRRSLIAALAVFVGVGACSPGLHASGRPLAERAEALQPHFKVRLPDGAHGPVPAALFFSGCGGVRQVQSDYAEAANEAGFAAVIVDSHGARGIGRTAARLQVCTALRLWGQARAADVFAAIALARADARLDADRLYLVGWSHGGWTILDALSYVADGETPPGLEALPTAPLSGVAGALVIYPYCGPITRIDEAALPDSPPVFAILAQNDSIASPEACEAILAREKAAGAPVEWVLRPGLTHAFDAPDQPPDPRMEFDPKAAAEARALFVERMRARVGAP